MSDRPSPLRVLFAGTPEFALPALQTLIEKQCEVVAVLTQPDRPAGRGKQLRASPVKRMALENGLEVLQPDSLKDNGWNDRLAALRPDLVVVVAFGLMIPAWLLDLPRFGCWNIHASLLPRWRGAAPIQRAIEAGDAQTGVCIMRIELSLDTGPVYQCLATPIDKGDTAGSLHDRLSVLGASALRNCLDELIEGTLPEPVVQDETKAVYATKLSKAEAQLDWNLPAAVLERKVRAFNPWPVAWCELGGERLRIWKAEVADEVIECRPGEVAAGHRSLLVGTSDLPLKILELQRPGGQRMPVAQYLNAQRSQAS